MGIAVVLRAENLSRIEALDRAYKPLVEWAERDRFPMLGHVDPYGNTIFNGGQMKAILTELDDVERLFPQVYEREADIVAQLRELCGLGARKPHLYLWFIGD